MIGLYNDDPPSRSLFHRLEFDEVWHFYAGDPLRLVLLYPDGSSADPRRPRRFDADWLRHVIPDLPVLQALIGSKFTGQR